MLIPLQLSLPAIKLRVAKCPALQLAHGYFAPPIRVPRSSHLPTAPERSCMPFIERTRRPVAPLSRRLKEIQGHRPPFFVIRWLSSHHSFPFSPSITISPTFSPHQTTLRLRHRSVLHCW